MSITVKEALELPDIQPIKLIGGAGGLHRPIKWVTIVEIVEDVTRLQEGEFLITTGYGLDTEKNREHFIRKLSGQNLSAVAIHTGFYMEQVPVEFIVAADEYGLPLFEIPRHMNFSQVTKALLGHMLNRQLQILQYTQQIHKELTSLALSNQGLPVIAATLAARIEADVQVYNAVHHCLGSSKGNGVSDEILVLLSNAFKNKMAPAFLAENRLAYPIAADQEYFGCLYIQREHAFSETDMLIMEQASTVCAIDFLKQKAVDEALLRIQGDFFDELLEKTGIDEEYVRKQSRRLGYELTGKMAILQIQAQTDASPLPFMQQFVSGQTRQILLREKQSSIVFLLKLSGKDGQIPSLTDRLRDEWDRTFSSPLHIGASAVFEGIQSIAEGARQAKQALQIALLTRQPVLHYENIGAYEPLFQMAEAGIPLTCLYEKLLYPLIEYDRKHHTKLLDTLECFLQNNTNMKNTAAMLFIHRHTLKYRLEQIEKKTGKDLQNTAILTQLHLALMAYRLDTAQCIVP
jgi:purine catabolism regulator